LDKNIGHWETTWFNFHILHLICFNLVGYDLYHRTIMLKSKPMSFIKRVLLWRKIGNVRKNATEGKLAPNREEHYRINEAFANDAYRLEHLDGRQIPRTWNASHLNFYFS